MSDFPPMGFTSKEDSKGFTMEQADPAIKPKMEGGYNMSRPRYTRRPRRTFSFDFTAIKESDRQLLENFWNDKKGGSMAFSWTIPPTGEEITVRFADKMKYSYVGQGGNHIWNVKGVKLEEV